MVTRMTRTGPSAGAAIAVNAELPEGDGKAVVQRMCVGCHGSGTFIQLRMSRQEWQAEVANMVARGATGSADEVRVVVDYLAKYLAGPARRPPAPREGR